jgi:hypothetical protein
LCLALPIFLRVIAQTLQANSAAHANKAALRMGAVTFIHRFGSSLNAHVHFHVRVVDAVATVDLYSPSAVTAKKPMPMMPLGGHATQGQFDFGF